MLFISFLWNPLRDKYDKQNKTSTSQHQECDSQKQISITNIVWLTDMKSLLSKWCVKSLILIKKLLFWNSNVYVPATRAVVTIPNNLLKVYRAAGLYQTRKSSYSIEKGCFAKSQFLNLPISDFQAMPVLVMGT